MEQLQKLHAWHQTKKGMTVFAAVELAIAYFFITTAIDTANLWAYTVGVIAIAGAIHNVLRITGIRKKRATKRK